MPFIQQTANERLFKSQGLHRLNLQFFSEPPTDPAPGNTDPTPGGNEPPTDPPKSFTQDDVNSIAAKEAKKAQEKLLKQLGISDFNSAKDGLEKFRAWQETQKTDQEKLNEQLAVYESQAKEKDDALFSLKAENAAIKVGITDEKNMNAVITLAKTKVSDDIDISQAIALVVEEFPHFAGTPQQNEPPKPQFSAGQHTKPPGGGDAFINALLGK